MVPQLGPFYDVSIIKISEESMEENYYSNNKPNKIIVANFYCCIFFIFLFKMQRFIIINFKNLITKLLDTNKTFISEIINPTIDLFLTDFDESQKKLIKNYNNSN